MFAADLGEYICLERDRGAPLCSALCLLTKLSQDKSRLVSRLMLRHSGPARHHRDHDRATAEANEPAEAAAYQTGCGNDSQVRLRW